MVGVNKLKQMVGVAINTYLVAVAQRELEYHLVTLLSAGGVRWQRMKQPNPPNQHRWQRMDPIDSLALSHA